MYHATNFMFKLLLLHKLFIIMDIDTWVQSKYSFAWELLLLDSLYHTYCVDIIIESTGLLATVKAHVILDLYLQKLLHSKHYPGTYNQLTINKAPPVS